MGKPEHFDVIVVGAGSSGCTLASRLSENPTRSIALLEAGPDFVDLAAIPEEVRSYLSKDAADPDGPYCWSLQADLSPDISLRIPRGRLLGGSSAINGTYFTRGTREDFDEWEHLGNTEWSFEKVLPFYRRMECDVDFKGDYHGSDGPTPVQRDLPARSHAITDAFFSGALELGFREEPDKNAPGPPGIGIIPRNRLGIQRMSTAIAYILPHRDRKNLTVRGGHLVRKVLFENRRAIGVEVETNGEIITMHADEIVLSAGAIKSPHLLLLSGVGPADELCRFGVDVVANSPGVGKGFSDHTHVTVKYSTPHQYPNGPESVVSHANLHVTSEGSSKPGDIEIVDFCGHKVVYSAKIGLARTQPAAQVQGLEGEYGFGLGLHQPQSQGEISLVSPDPNVQPNIAYHLMSTDADLKATRDATRIINALLETKAFRGLGARRMSPTDEDCSSDKAFDSWIRTVLSTATHASRSCHMGPESDETAVVDQYCKVRGVENLRVADTSVMPVITSRGPSATAVMIGERVADFFD